ncbi:hypothetical protein BK666_23165 [Pseudomonas frederiksbergensis]|uniref:Uncharacterized protein n=1 Tax=Pseudomonas frederiksbergensis TaxID=104087 RepID=A0A423JW64_9PSED|nr:hypothetical protein BK666_23165 [Pseudomonas frederiksbergensis]
MVLAYVQLSSTRFEGYTVWHSTDAIGFNNHICPHIQLINNTESKSVDSSSILADCYIAQWLIKHELMYYFLCINIENRYLIIFHAMHNEQQVVVFTKCKSTNATSIPSPYKYSGNRIDFSQIPTGIYINNFAILSCQKNGARCYGRDLTYKITGFRRLFHLRISNKCRVKY